MSIWRKFKKWFVNIDTGFLKDLPRLSDYKVGESPIDHNIRIYDGNWEDHLPEDELQKRNYVETMSCVSFSALNSIEMQINWMINTGKIGIGAYEFLSENNYISNSKVNLSDRFLAIMSSTTPNGNYLTKVAQTIRDYGILPEDDLPFGKPTSFNDYHNKADIDDAMIALAEKSKEFFNFQYEWVVAPNEGGTLESRRLKVLKHLQQAPLQLAKSGHATAYFDGVKSVRFMQYDTYGPFIKERPWKYDPYYVMKILVTEKSEFNDAEIAKAKTTVLDTMKGRKAPYFFRPDKNGEAYYMNPDGSFKYKKGIPCSLFESLVVQEYITPISEGMWEQFKPAEIK